MRKPFRFKQFEVSDEACAMKLGTDAVLLGAWVRTEGLRRVLDVGTGCGILALMMAQRTQASVDAVEIHRPSARAAARNFRESPWRERLRCLGMDFLQFIKIPSEPYDLIVSNPPYFRRSLKPLSGERALSRHEGLLNLGDLAAGAAQLLSPAGRLAVVLPFRDEAYFSGIAEGTGLYPVRLLEILSFEGRPPLRVLMELAPGKAVAERETLFLKNPDGSRSAAHLRLTEPFYL